MQAAKREAIHETDDEISRRTPNEAFDRVVGAADSWVRGRKYGTGQCRSLLPIRFVSCRVHRKARRGAAAAAGRARRGDPRGGRRRCWRAAWNTDESWRSCQPSRQALTSQRVGIRSIDILTSALTPRVLARRAATIEISGRAQEDFAAGLTAPSAPSVLPPPTFSGIGPACSAVAVSSCSRGRER
jgi:hypothetical protein